MKKIVCIFVLIFTITVCLPSCSKCETCDGIKKIECDNCLGRGVDRCDECVGTEKCILCISGFLRKDKGDCPKCEYGKMTIGGTKYTCRQCDGTGRIFEEEKCWRCSNTGQCDTCRGSGINEFPFTCDKCNGQGKVTCPDCSK